MTADTRIFTGFRIQLLDQSQQPYAWADLKKRVEPLAKALQLAMQEPRFTDDSIRHLGPLNILIFALQSGELFTHVIDDKFVGMIMLRNIVFQRHATIEAWAHPDFRQTYAGRKELSKFAKEVYRYAFKPWSHGDMATNGLGLKKIKAEIATDNKPAIRAALSQGFRIAGVSPLDAFFHGQPSDMLLVELLNPMFFGVPTQGILANDERSKSSSDPDLHTSGVHSGSSVLSTPTVCVGTEPAVGGAERSDADGHNEPRRTGRKPAAPKPANRKLRTRSKSGKPVRK